MIDVLDFSNSLLYTYHMKHGKSMSVLKLQKLCYYCQAWYYTFFSNPLFNGDFIAEEKGPTCEAIAFEYLNRIDKSGEIIYDCLDDSSFNSEVGKFVDIIIELYGSYDGKLLSDMTHTETPWLIARNNSQIGKLAPVIDFECMKRFYSNHAFYDVISPKLKNSFNYKKFVLLDKCLALAPLKGEELKAAENLVDSMRSSPPDKSILKHTYGDAEYEFFKIDYNIMLITQEVRDYIMAQSKLITEMKNLLDEKRITFFWQYDNGLHSSFYTYTAPELGIMVNEKSFEDAVKSVIEMLKHIKRHYDSKSVCNSQDENEKALIDKVYTLYEMNKSEFLNLLGLNERTQLQGERINAT